MNQPVANLSVLMDAEIGPVVGKMPTAAKAVEQFGRRAQRSMDRASFHTGNLAAQFNDIGVMLASGQSPLILAAQQGTQINQVLGQMGTTGKDRLRALAGAFTSVISPANLMTIGIIAGGAALVQFANKALKADDGTENLSASMAELASNTATAKGEIDRLALGLDNIAQLRATEEIARLKSLIQEVSKEIARLEESGADENNIFGFDGGDQLAQARLTLTALQKQLRETESILQENIEVNEEKVSILSTTKEIADAERQVGEQLEEIVRQQALAAAEARNMRDAAMEAAREFMAVQQLRSRFAGEEIVMGQDVLAVGRGDPAPEKEKKRRGGSRVDPLEQLVESLKTEQELVQEWYEESQRLLLEANAAELEAIGGHNEAKLRLEEEYRDRMREIQDYAQAQAFSSMLGAGQDILAAVAGNNEKLLKASKAFGAAQALIDAWMAHNATLRDPTLPWFMRAAAAAQVLATGLSGVSAIKGVSSGGGGQTTTSSAASANTSSAVALQLVGSENATFSRTQVVDLINQINEATEDGAIVRLV